MFPGMEDMVQNISWDRDVHEDRLILSMVACKIVDDDHCLRDMVDHKYDHMLALLHMKHHKLILT